MKKVGIITFHRSYNCGSMLESYAIHHYLRELGVANEIIDFSNEGQRKLYAVFSPNKSVKSVLKNIIIYPHKHRIAFNNLKYEEFKNTYFQLSKELFRTDELEEMEYGIVIAGSDQIWNITIEDSDDAYFLSWAKQARKVAYAPSFGAKNILCYSEKPERYRTWINAFDALSVREQNGVKWIKDLIGKEVEVLPDPTLLLNAEDYDELLDDSSVPKEKYIFFYSPFFQRSMCKFVKKLSRKYKMKVMTWSTKSYYTRFVSQYGFLLPPYESPSVYLSLIKNASLIITTSFHGTVFASVYRKKFYVIKNGGMYGDDDRVWTLLENLKMTERLISDQYYENYDYLKEVNYQDYELELHEWRKRAYDFLDDNVRVYYNE